MSLFDSLFVAHLIGDWLLQTEWQAENKTRNWRAMFSHIAVYHLVVLAVMWARLGFQDLRVYPVIAVLAVSHAVFDRRTLVAWLMRTLRLTSDEAREPSLPLIIDQVLHILMLALAAVYLSG